MESSVYPMEKIRKSVRYFLFTSVLVGAAIIAFFALKGSEKTKPTFNTRAVNFSDLPNWHADNLTEMWPAFVRSCEKLKMLPKETVFLNEGRLSDWQEACFVATNLNPTTDLEIRHFFETYFVPYKVTSGSVAEGSFTGYYVPELRGSRTQKHPYTTAVYKRPSDLVMVEDLGIYRKELKGMRIAGRVVNGNLQPYATHAEITNGALVGNELLWVEDPIDAFFMQIQGSGIIKLDSGESVYLSYAGTNGHPYSSIGKILIQQQVLTQETVSMQSIRAWLYAHPDQAKALMQQNASFVFFKEVSGKEPIGAQGVALTAGRSLAIDPVFIAYGTPIWLNVEHPTSLERIQRLVVAQDKGGAIKGPIRGDLFWGSGDAAGELAGKMKSKGSYYVLLPKVRGVNP